jgi:hypothetical protein
LNDDELESEIVTISSRSTLLHSKKGELQTLQYFCYTMDQRDTILSLIHDLGIMNTSLSFPQTFIVGIGIFQNKDADSRSLKLTHDSVIVFDSNKKIIREIPYSTIVAYHLDDEQTNEEDQEVYSTKKFSIFFSDEKFQKNKYNFRSSETETLQKALLDAIIRFRVLFPFLIFVVFHFN